MCEKKCNRLYVIQARLIHLALTRDRVLWLPSYVHAWPLYPVRPTETYPAISSIDNRHRSNANFHRNQSAHILFVIEPRSFITSVPSWFFVVWSCLSRLVNLNTENFFYLGFRGSSWIRFEKLESSFNYVFWMLMNIFSRVNGVWTRQIKK